ncbi:S41 family peptidase [Candidatus Peregrinibacteria bacterium]|nr:S41 family peptidase [Candidatus Peregrinibacteria bacterium]
MNISRCLRRFLGATAVLFLVPLTLSAAPMAQTLATPDGQAVSRGDFIRSAVAAVGIPVQATGKVLPYRRPVPASLQPAIRAAWMDGALAIFGNDLLLSRSITRGEALFVLMKLQGLKARGGVTVHFQDVPPGSDLEAAVQVATEKGWMEPLSTTLFGAARVLTGREARMLLGTSGGTGTITDTIDGDRKVPGIVVRLRTRQPMTLPNEELLRGLWQILREQFLYKDKLTDDEAAYKAAEALVQAAGDPYTMFMRPVSAKQFQDRLQGEVTGIGAQVEFKDNILTVVAPIPGSPAEKAGLTGGDQIIAVDGVKLLGLDFAEAVNKVRGPKGSVAGLTIRRDGTEMNIQVVRDLVKVPEVTITFQGDIAVVKLVQFGERTRGELRTLLTDVQARHPKGIILDLRNNPGGLLDAADIVVSNFVPAGSPVASINYRERSYIETTADPPTIDAGVPMVVLINKGSASASEIVAGVLQERKRATVIGEQSFGKGTVQEVIEFKNGASLKLTIAEWKTPAGHAINGVGVTPDILITTTGERDDQLLKAIDLLR